MSDTIKLSVIIPVYNVGKYLEQCLKSIAAQTLTDIEIICVNDGSKDNSLSILEEFAKADKRFKIVNKENSGYGHTINTGIVAAKGEYIGIVESDDFIKPEMYEALYELAKQNDCDIAKSDWYDYWENPEKTIKNGKIAKRWTGKVLNAKDDNEILRIKPSIWSAIYKREFLIQNKIKFLETQGASFQDTSFTFKVFSSAQKVAFTSKAYLFYRQDNSNSSVKNRGKIYCICDEYREIESFLSSNPMLKSTFNAQKLILQYNSYMWNLKRIEKSFREEFLQHFHSTFKDYFEHGELTEDFFKKINKGDTTCLIKNPEKFLKRFEGKLLKGKLNDLRRKLISVKINSSRISISLFGKQIVRVE